MSRSDDDKTLWRRFADQRRSADVPAEGEEMLQLAAWLDGRLSEVEREAVESWLAADPDRLGLALSAAGSKELAALWPKRAEARASALVPTARLPLRLIAAAAAAAILVALGGFEMGSAGSEVLSAGSETDLAAQIGLVPETDVMETLL